MLLFLVQRYIFILVYANTFEEIFNYFNIFIVIITTIKKNKNEKDN